MLSTLRRLRWEDYNYRERGERERGKKREGERK